MNTVSTLLEENGNPPAKFLLNDYTTFKVVVENADVIENGTENITREDAVVGLMKKNKRISVREISAKLNIPRRTLFRVIDSLKTTNRIKRIGSENQELGR